MKSHNCKDGKGGLTSLLCLFPIVFTAAAAGADTMTARAVSCAPAGDALVRHIELRRHTGSNVRCDVLYTKPDEGGSADVLWSSAANEGFCEDRFEQFVGKHRDEFGWNCNVSVPESPDSPTALARSAVPEPEVVGVVTGTFEANTDEQAPTVVGANTEAPPRSAGGNTAGKLRRVASVAGANQTDETPPWIDVAPDNPLVKTVFPDASSVSARVMDIALALESQKIGYNTEDLSDCSGVFHRVLGALQRQFPTIELPTPRLHRSTRRLARWYHERGLLRLVASAADEFEAIRPGVVLFYGQNHKRYENPSAEYLFDRATGIAHMGVVVDVAHDAEGRVIGYGLFHGRRTGTEAKITRYHRRSPSKPSHPPYGNGAEQWVAYAPVLPLATPPLSTEDQIAENTE